ncbi:hypothetical protein D3C80_2083720 [compost metagenome]
MQVGGAELVGHGFHGLGVAVADVLVAQDRRVVGTAADQQGGEREGENAYKHVGALEN